MPGGYPGAYTASITNRANCGGNKKAGLAPTVGVPINILVSKNYQANPPNCCTQGGPCLAANVKNRPVQRITMIY